MGGFYTAVTGATITATNWNDYVRDQTVNRYATAAARTSADTALAQGKVSYRNDLGSGGGVEHYNGTAWVPTGAQLIASTTLGAGAATITFSSITASYSSLYLFGLGSVAGVGTSVDCTLVVNSDTGANYSNSSVDTNQAALNPAGAFNSGQTSAVWGIALPGSSYNANRSGAFCVRIPGYSNTTFRKIGITEVYMTDGGTNFNQKHRYWWWNGTAAITTLLLTSGSGNFSAGTHIGLYGMP